MAPYVDIVRCFMHAILIHLHEKEMKKLLFSSQLFTDCFKILNGLSFLVVLAMQLIEIETWHRIELFRLANMQKIKNPQVRESIAAHKHYHTKTAYKHKTINYSNNPQLIKD